MLRVAYACRLFRSQDLSLTDRRRCRHASDLNQKGHQQEKTKQHLAMPKQACLLAKEGSVPRCRANDDFWSKLISPVDEGMSANGMDRLLPRGDSLQRLPCSTRRSSP